MIIIKFQIKKFYVINFFFKIFTSLLLSCDYNTLYIQTCDTMTRIAKITVFT